MIPHPGQSLTDEQRLRWRFTELAAQLVRAGVPADVVLADARQGVEAVDARAAVQSGRHAAVEPPVVPGDAGEAQKRTERQS